MISYGTAYFLQAVDVGSVVVLVVLLDLSLLKHLNRTIIIKQKKPDRFGTFRVYK